MSLTLVCALKMATECVAENLAYWNYLYIKCVEPKWSPINNLFRNIHQESLRSYFSYPSYFSVSSQAINGLHCLIALNWCKKSIDLTVWTHLDPS